MTVVPFFSKFEIPSTFLGKMFRKLLKNVLEITENVLESPANDSRHLSGNPVMVLGYWYVFNMPVTIPILGLR